MKIKGSLDAALGVADLLNHERSKIYGSIPIAPSPSVSQGATHEESEYSEGSPAPVTADIKSRL